MFHQNYIAQHLWNIHKKNVHVEWYLELATFLHFQYAPTSLLSLLISLMMCMCVYAYTPNSILVIEYKIGVSFI